MVEITLLRDRVTDITLSDSTDEKRSKINFYTNEKKEKL